MKRLRLLRSLRVLRVRPGDVVVYRCPERLSPEHSAQVRHALKRHFENNPVLVIDSAGELGAIRVHRAGSSGDQDEEK